MKKGLTYGALAALSVSAVVAAPAPQASAADTVQMGFYNIVKGKYTSVNDFKKQSKTEKRDLFRDRDVYFVSNQGVIRAIDVITVTNAELPSKLTAIADFQKTYDVNFD